MPDLQPGSIFGHWTVLGTAVSGTTTPATTVSGTDTSRSGESGSVASESDAPRINESWRYVKCRCSCGVEKLVDKYNLIRGTSKSCGHLLIHEDVMVGQTFDHWTVLRRDTARRGAYFCRCVCGEEKSVTTQHLITGASRSCGCRGKEDLTGKTFGCWTVLRKEGQYHLCRCMCGTERAVQTKHLLSGRSKSCGCRLRKQGMKNKSSGGGSHEKNSHKKV